MERSMNGIALPKESDQMRYILAYMKWLDYGLPKLNSKDFKGYPKIELPSVAVNLKKGKSIYLKECVVCHGENGQGMSQGCGHPRGAPAPAMGSRRWGAP